MLQAETTETTENIAEQAIQQPPEQTGFMVDMARWVLDLFGVSHTNELLATFIMLVVSTAVSLSLIWVTRAILEGPVKRFISRSRSKWDDAIFNAKVRARMAYLPAIFSMTAFGSAIDYDNWLHTLYMKFVFLYMTLVVSQFLIAMLNGIFRHISNVYPKARSLNSLRQLIGYIIWAIMLIVMVGIILDKNPGTLIAGLGASAALMSLVFKETIQSLVSGIQLSANNMLEPGDWIVVPGADANGVVTEVNLNTVKIQNWDNTITTVPPSTLLSGSFTNWKGMQQGPGRRLDRSICINMDSVRFIAPEEEARFAAFPELNLFFESRKKQDLSLSEQLTNLTLYRQYIYSYLLRSPKILNPEKGVELMVRYLQPTQYGLPVEVYCFTVTKVWAEYEGIISDVVDFMIASMPIFGLRPYQVVANEADDNHKIITPEHRSTPKIEQSSQANKVQ